MLRNINMKFDIDMMHGVLLAMLIALYTIQLKEDKRLQTQIDELKLIIDNKFLSSMILDKENLMVR